MISCVSDGVIVGTLKKKRLTTARPNLWFGNAKIYSNLIALTGEIFVMMYDGTNSITKQSTSVHMFNAIIYAKLI